MTYEVKTPMALSCTQDGKNFWGFNAELITTWQGLLPPVAFSRLKKFDHECLNTTEASYVEGLVDQFDRFLSEMEKEMDLTLLKAWLKIEPDRLLQIRA